MPRRADNRGKKAFLSVPLVALLGDPGKNDRFRAFYGRIAEACQEHGLETYEPYYFGHPVDHDYIRPDEIYSANRRRIADSDLLVAYVGEVSGGVAMEIEIANEHGVPIILLYEEERQGSISKMILGCHRARDHIVAADLDGITAKFCEKIGEILGRLIPVDSSNEVRSQLSDALSLVHGRSSQTIGQVSQQSGVDKGYLSRLLAGKIADPGRDQIIKLCGWGWKLPPDETNRVLIVGGYTTLW